MIYKLIQVFFMLPFVMPFTLDASQDTSKIDYFSRKGLELNGPTSILYLKKVESFRSLDSAELYKMTGEYLALFKQKTKMLRPSAGVDTSYIVYLDTSLYYLNQYAVYDTLFHYHKALSVYNLHLITLYQADLKSNFDNCTQQELLWWKQFYYDR
jgi:hypothetical protein